MIDGLGADYFAKYRHRLPFLNAIAERGALVERLSPERCATSLPGRTSMITGVSSAKHGIYGNVIWSGDGNGESKSFRHANWADVKTSTVAEQATKAGLKVANLGFGMLNPAHSELYYPPIWTHEMVQSKDKRKLSEADQNWLDQAQLAKHATWLADLTNQGYPEGPVARDYDHPSEYLISGQMNDQIMVDWTAGLAITRSDVDFIITELSMPDYFLHRYGCEHDITRFAIETADAQVGRVITALKKAGQLHEYNIMVTSDHGFSAVEHSIHPEYVLENDDNQAPQFSCEGGVLHLHYNNAKQLQSYSDQLAEHGVLPFSNDYLPEQDRSQIATFLAPEHCDFYLDKHHCRQAIGPSNYKANHGFKAGHSADERFLVMAGPDVQVGIINRAQAEQVAPTMARLMGLDNSVYPQTAIG